VITTDDVKQVTERCRSVPRTQNRYVATDYVSALLETVLDFRIHTTTVVRAMEHYNAYRWQELRTIEDLKACLARFPADQDGDTALALHLWGNRHWTRAHMLRGLTAFFDAQRIWSIETLREWAVGSDFKRDFAGRVKGLGPTVYRWLVMRLGVETVKPDTHLHCFVEHALGRTVSDDDVVAVVSAAANRLGMRAYELDSSIWEYQTARR